AFRYTEPDLYKRIAHLLDEKRSEREAYIQRVIEILQKELRAVGIAPTMQGVVHDLWTPIEGEFDDYIANPKANRYQSLHTAVIGPEGKTLEVQIRTEEMHQLS